MTDVPEDLARLLEGRPDVESSEQAFPFLTVDEAGFPHVALLSRSEIDIPSDRSHLRVAVASTGTRANLLRTERAGLIAIDGTVAHYAKLRVVRTIEIENLLGCALRLEHHKRESAGIPMEPSPSRPQPSWPVWSAGTTAPGCSQRSAPALPWDELTAARPRFLGSH